MEYRKIKLQNGYLVVPENFVVLEKSVTEKADYAGVVEEKNGNVPHYVFLSEIPVSEYTAEDEERIYALCGEVNPEVISLREQEIDLQYDANGNILNATEWQLAPRFGAFVIPEVASEEELYLGTGIIRKER